MRKHSVLNQVRASIIVGITIIAMVACIWIWGLVRKEQFADLAYTASVLDRYYELTFYHRELSLSSVGYRLLDIKGPDQDSLRLAFAKESLAEFSELLAFGLADTTGQVTTFTGGTTGIPAPNLISSVTSRRSFLDAMKRRRISIGEVYFHKSIGEWMLPIRFPLRDENGKVIAVNTSALAYQRMIRDLESFEFNSNYRIHFINELFGTTQLYHPLDSNDYAAFLGKTDFIYADTVRIKEERNLQYYTARNSAENVNILGVATTPNLLNHRLMVSVDKRILVNTFYRRVRFVLLGYVTLFISIVLGFRFLRNKQSGHDEQMIKERAYSATIIEESPSLIVGIGVDGICQFANKTTLITILYEKRDIIGKNWWKTVYPGQYFDQVTQLFEKFEKGEVSNHEMTLIRKDGKERIIAWNSSTLRNDVDEALQIIGFGRDVTELKQAQKDLTDYTDNLENLVKSRTEELDASNGALLFSNNQLKSQQRELRNTLKNLKKTQKQLYQADKMASLGVLVAGVSHEINNPLNFIKGGVQGLIHLLSNGKWSTEKAEPFFKIINEGVERAANIVKSLGHFSRKSGAVAEDCDVHDIIENCLTILNNRFKHKIEVELFFNAKNAKLVANEGKLHQAILNLLSNAEQAVVESGTITVTTDSIDNKLEIGVKDSGIGIDESLIPKIADPFFTTKAPGEGTGLGLSITYSIIEELGGSIEVKSEFGVGTEFIIRLPQSLSI